MVASAETVVLLIGGFGQGTEPRPRGFKSLIKLQGEAGRVLVQRFRAVMKATGANAEEVGDGVNRRKLEPEGRTPVTVGPEGPRVRQLDFGWGQK